MTDQAQRPFSPNGETRPTALVTGASRGVGKGIALALARRGYVVGITARTVAEGDPTAVAPENGIVLPGSLHTTMAEIAAAGGEPHAYPLDLLDGPSLVPIIEQAIGELGHLDVLVNNAIYVGPGNDRLFLDNEPGDLERRVFGNLTAQLLITQAVLRHMVDRGAGTIINITSNAGQVTPPGPVGRNGWALGYAASKAGFHRIADMVAVEYGDAGIRAYNICPGMVATERVLSAAQHGWIAKHGATPELIGETVAWLIETDQPPVANGGYLHAQELAAKLGLTTPSG